MGLGLGQYGLFFPNVRKWITVPLSITTHKTLTLNFPHEGHVPNAIKGFFLVFWPFINVSIFQVNTFLFEFLLTISILQVGLHSSCSPRHWGDEATAHWTERAKWHRWPGSRQNTKLSDLTRILPISRQPLVVHTATRALSTNPIVVYYSSCTLAFRRSVLTSIRTCRLTDVDEFSAGRLKLRL